MKLPRVLVLHTGGTFGMEIQESKPSRRSAISLAVPHLSKDLLKKRFRNLVPELEQLAHCDVEILLNRDSSHIGLEEWNLIANKIRSEWKSYDGIVLLHGTDTLAYTASALSFLLSPCLIPIVITGAQRPLAALRTDARTNLISAVEIAARGPRELVNQITVFFGDHLFQGNRVRKKSATDYAAFESPQAPPLAVVGTTIRYSDLEKPTHPLTQLKLLPQFSQKVLTVHATPNFPSYVFNEKLLSSLDGIVLVVFQSGTAPTHDPSFLNFLKLTQKLKIPITIATETSNEPPAFFDSTVSYAAGKELIQFGCYSAGNMTLECAFVKTSLLLGQFRDLARDPKKFASLWKANLAHEQNQHE